MPAAHAQLAVRQHPGDGEPRRTASSACTSGRCRRGPDGRRCDEAVLFEDLDPGTYRSAAHGLLATEFYEAAPFYSGADDITVYGLTGIEAVMQPASTAPLSLIVDADDDGVDVLPGDGSATPAADGAPARRRRDQPHFATDIQLTPRARHHPAVPGADETTPPLATWTSGTGDRRNGGSVDGASSTDDAFAPSRSTSTCTTAPSASASEVPSAARSPLPLDRASNAGRGGGYWVTARSTARRSR
ncbi:MAG: hypothetical protein R2699_12705 [Acidimicrobiales bacterium]